MTRILRVVLALAAGYVALLLAGYFFGVYAVKRHHLESAWFILSAVLLARLLTLKASDSPAPAATGWQIALAVTLLGGAAYSRALGVGYLSDDYVLRSWVSAGHLRWVDSHLARPVALALWRLVFLLGGGAASLHFVNVALHVTNTILAGRLAGRLGLGRPGVLVASLVFLLWPTQIEAVAWSSGVFDVLSTTWILSALVIASRPEPLLRTDLDAVLVVALAALALFTKESAVALPLLALLALAFRPAQGHLLRRQIVLWMSILAATAAYLSWRMWAQLPVATTSNVTRYVIKEQLSRTFATLALPLSEESAHAYPLVAFLIVSAVAALGVVAVMQTDRRSPGHVVALKGLAWCVVAPLPTFGLLFIGPYLDGSRYLYLAAFGWGLTLGGILEASWSHRLLRSAVIAVLAVLLVAVGIEQQERLSDWRGAASERDMILAEAAGLAKARPCASIVASDLPPRYKGAQLFTNGFAEATVDMRSNSPSAAPCDWTWTGSAFRQR